MKVVLIFLSFLLILEFFPEMKLPVMNAVSKNREYVQAENREVTLFFYGKLTYRGFLHSCTLEKSFVLGLKTII